MAEITVITAILVFLLSMANGENLPPVFTQVMNNLALSEATPVGTVVYKLEGYDPEGSNVSFGLVGTDNFRVNPKTGEVTVIRPLDREEQDTLSFLVSIKDQINASEDSENDNLVEVPINVIILDENDNAPQFQNVPYEAEVLESALPGLSIFDKILVTDKDTVGDSLEISCLPHTKTPDSCSIFIFNILESTQNILRAAVVLNDTLDYNERTIYYVQIVATDGMHSTTTDLEVRVKDVQNTPPVFQGSLAAVVDEDSPIGTLVLEIKARDGDRGEPRKIVYDLLTNPMDYFMLNSKTGELRTARTLDKEALSDATGLVTLSIRARELVDGTPGSDNTTTAITQASVTIRDVNDSPPLFNKKEYYASIVENTSPGTPLALEMSVSDKDVGINSVFSLRLQDISEVFDIEPKIVRGSSQVSIHVANGTLDYENPNQRKFIVLVIAEETETHPKLSSTATITVSVIDANDNRPTFEEESYTASVSESAQPGQFITSITAKDMDSGSFGTQGIRYNLSGTGAELFQVDPVTGVITVADCFSLRDEDRTRNLRKRRDLLDSDENAVSLESYTRNVNITSNGLSGVVLNTESTLDVEMAEISAILNSDFSASTTTEDNTENTILDESTENIFASFSKETIGTTATSTTTEKIFQQKTIAKQSCLDYETKSVYFLSYKATDDNGKGQTSVVSLKIAITDANDSPPVCESPLYRASVDEGAQAFDPPLLIKARDADKISNITYTIIGNEVIHKLFDVNKITGEIFIKDNAVLDVNHLRSDNVYFSVEANDGLFSAVCAVNVTIRDVNNHAPHFPREHYVASIAENAEIGTSVEQLNAIDLDTGINAEMKYRIQQGSFDDFRIDNKSGLITVNKKLDFDRRNTYQIEVLATDLGTPSLSGTTTLTVNIINSNDKNPYFTPSTQRAEVREDVPVGTVIHKLTAIDPDITSVDALEFAATEPVTAVDKDGKEIQNAESFKEMFSISTTGNVSVNQKLDRDFFAVIRITVIVTDSTAPTLQQGKGLLIISVIGVNEIPPKFALPWTVDDPILNLQVLEEQPIGSILTTLQASDEDSTIAEYNLTDNSYFEVNATTGVITSKARVDYEKVREVRFFATVTDTGIPQLTSTAELIVNVINMNDNDPYFLEKEYVFEVLENSPRGTVVGKVEAKDDDLGIYGELIYSLVGEYSRNFQIDSSTGIIIVANSSFIDREKVSSVNLNAIVVDKAPITTQKSTTAKILINIVDVNDNPPIFTQETYTSSVAENAAFNPPAALLQVLAEDKDDGAFGEVRYFIIAGNDDGLFKLDTNTGILYPGKSLLAKQGEYELSVEARDGRGAGPHKHLTTVFIKILSINQHRPVFVMPALSNATVELPGDVVKTNYLVMTVKATDTDTGENGRVSYHLQVDNNNVQETNAFTIDEFSGELRTKRELNRKSKDIYELVLVARDHGSPSGFETLRFLTIVLVDVNENRPEFPDASNPYKFSIVENRGRDIKVGKVQAIKKNKDNEVFYYILDGNVDGAFYLDKTGGDLYTNKSLDRETIDMYTLYILASNKADFTILDMDRNALSMPFLNRDTSVAKVYVTILDMNDNEPIFEKAIYYAGVNSKSSIDEFVTLVNATDRDYAENATLEYLITASNLYKFGSLKPTGSIVPSPFSISRDGRITTAAFMAEYNQDRFELDIVAKEVEFPKREARTKVYIWVFDSEQLVRVILSKPPAEVHQERDEIVAELRNATNQLIIVDEIRYHVDSMGRIRMDWCDLYFHAVNPKTQEIIPVSEVLKVIDANYDYLRDYYAGFAIENVIPAYTTFAEEEFDLALAALVALLIVLFVGAVSFAVLCCCLKHWNLSIPSETRRKEALIKKQFIEDLNTTENPLWIEQKLKLYEEQELTMQVFSEPELSGTTAEPSPSPPGRRNSYEPSTTGDNTYATIQPRSNSQMGENADYATLRNNRSPPMVYEFTGSTFQAPIREQDDFVTELI